MDRPFQEATINYNKILPVAYEYRDDRSTMYHHILMHGLQQNIQRNI